MVPVGKIARRIKSIIPEDAETETLR